MNKSKRIGTTINKIRKLKSLKIKDITNNGQILSKSAYYRFVNGESNIQATQFMNLLFRLNTSLKEFEFIHNDYQLPKVEQILQLVLTAASKQDIHTLKKLSSQAKNNFSKTNSYQYQHLLITIELFIHKLEGIQVGITNPSLTPDLQTGVDNIVHYLLNLELWSEYDIVICNNIYFAISVNQRSILLNTAIKCFKKYQTFTSETSQFFMFLSNLIFLDVQTSQVKNIPSIYNNMCNIPLSPNWTTEPLVLKFCQGLNDYLLGIDRSLTYCENAINIASELQVSVWVQNFTLILDTFKHTIKKYESR
ncbi:transcriptional regulator [Lactiplantibacillus plantarum]|uniref:Rgg family transcriptional regulator n=1 Tax=Lactiplantibacillus plantarum TaxID=1590 RepID=UPI0009321AA7|nr:hypothetical protein [Lactiplantibacillus plantarum]MDV9115869.1 transcriptional regulator [Lactiplantibacillus plantarum]